MALDHGHDVEALAQAAYPGGGTVAEAIANAIATVGENMTLRRAAGLAVKQGVIGHYVHGPMGEGLGKIGVIVGLESTGDETALKALGRQIAMHIAATSPLGSRCRLARSRHGGPREGRTGREEHRQAGRMCWTRSSRAD